MRKKEKQKNVTNSFIVGIIGCFIFIGVIIVYTKDVVILKEEVSLEEEINLGDTCSYQYSCPRGLTKVDNYNCCDYEIYGANNYYQCTFEESGTFVGNKCWSSCYSTTSQQVCTACDAGKNLVNGKCEQCSITSIEPIKAVSAGDNVTITVNTTCNNINVSCKNASCGTSASKTPSANKINFSVRIGTECEDVKIEVSAGNSQRKELTIPKDAVRKSWSHYCSNCSLGYDIPTSIQEASEKGSNYYGSGCEKRYMNVMICDKIYSRGVCNTTVTPFDYCCVKDDNTDASWKYNQTSIACPSGWHVDEKINTQTSCNRSNLPPACYINASTIEEATDAIFTTPDKVPGKYHFVDLPESKCKIVPKATYCKFEDYHEYNSKVSKQETKKCEDNVEINFKDGKKCDQEEMAYYKIECDNKYTFSYDNNNDIDYDNSVETTNTVIPGEGFGFGITVLVTRTCKGTFNAKKWKEDYNRLSDGLKKLKDKSDINFVENQLSELKKFVEIYNSYDNFKLRDVTGDFKIQYNLLNSKKEKLETKFTILELEEGKGDYISKSTIDLGVRGVKNPINYTWSNTMTPKAYRLIFPFVYLDSATGEITNNKDGVEGGHRLFVSSDADVQTKKMEVNLIIDGLTSNGNPTISNKECELKIVKPEYKYRPIDVANPFINSDYKKGANWLNSLFDFTKVIQKDIWTKKPLYVIDLSPKDIENIQSNNAYYIKAGKSPYFGLCKVLTSSEIKKDPVVKKLCDAFNVKY